MNKNHFLVNHLCLYTLLLNSKHFFSVSVCLAQCHVLVMKLTFLGLGMQHVLFSLLISVIPKSRDYKERPPQKRKKLLS